MEFDFDRADAVGKVEQSEDRDDYYVFHSWRVGPIWVRKDRLRIEHHPEVGQSTGKALLDYAGHGSETEAILAASTKQRLADYFAENNLPFPGFRRTRRARVIN